MNRFLKITLSGALLVSAHSYAAVECTRAGLQEAVDIYLAGQAKGDYSKLPLATGLGMVENFKAVAIADTILAKALPIDNKMTLIDEASCQTYTEVISTSGAEPYAFGTRMRINHALIAEIETLWTTTGYWGFNGEAYLRYAKAENWGVLPEAKRNSRADIVKAGNAYLDAFLEQKTDLVPWGYPCARTEGGMHVEGDQKGKACESGVPGNVNIANRHWVVDETMGTVAIFCTFGAGGPNGGSGAPDTHVFRVESGKLRYVHTMTHLMQNAGPGGGKGKGKGGAPTTPPGTGPGAGKGAPGAGPGRGGAPKQ